MKELSRGIKINIIANFLRFSRLGFTFLAALLYGTELFGVYTVVWAITEVLIYFGRLGLNQGLLFELAHLRESGENDRLYGKIGASLKAMLLVSIIEACLFALYAYLYVDVDEIRRGIYILAPLIPFYAIGILFLHATMGLKDMRYNALIRSGAEPAALLIFVLIFWKTPFKHYGIILAQAASLLTTFLLGLWAYGRRFSWNKTFQALSTKVPYRQLVHYSLPMYFMGLMDTVLYRSDILLISYFLGAGSVEQQKILGIYGFAKQIARVLNKTKNAFSTIFLPVTSESYLKEDTETLWSQVRYATEKILLLNIGLCLFLMGLGPYLLEIFGKDASLLPPASYYCLVFGQFALSTFSVYMYFLISTKEARRFLSYEFLIIVASILAGSVAVKQFATLGVALSISLGYLAIGLTATAEMFRVHPKDFFNKKLLLMLASGIAAGGIIFFIKSMVPVYWNEKIVMAGALAFGLLLFFAINTRPAQWRSLLKW